MATIKANAIDGLKKQVDDVTSNPDGAAGVVYCAVNKKGELVFQHASGKLGKGIDKPMTMDTVFWIASCTKMITGIACMQLCEQGKLSLDDVGIVEKLAPVSRVCGPGHCRTLNKVLAGVEGGPGHRWRKARAKEERHHPKNAALAYWQVKGSTLPHLLILLCSWVRILIFRFSPQRLLLAWRS